MPTAALLQVLVPLLFGTVIGFVPNLLLESRKNRNARHNRWTDALYEASVELMSASRRSEHLIEQVQLGNVEAGTHIDEEHQKLRVALEKIFILGDTDVQRTARRVVAHTWAQRLQHETGADPHPATGGLPVQERSKLARRAFYRAVRHQLRVPGETDWAPAISELPEQERELHL